MADRINSQKKLDYAKQSAEVLASAKKDIQDSVENLKALCDKIRMAVTDRAYNNIAYIATFQVKAINTYAKAVAEDILTPLATGPAISGEALKQGAAKILPDLEEIAAYYPDMPAIDTSVIESRGLDENWTDATRNEFSDECLKFITIRSRLMAEIGEITTKNNESDMHDTYMNIGKEFEKHCNATVSNYNELKRQLEEAGICVAEAIAQAETAGAKIKAVGDIGSVKNVLGEEDML